MINRLDKLGEVIREGAPAEVLYDLGRGEERSELLVVFIDGENIVATRIDSSPQIRLSRDDRGLLMDISDSGEGDRYSYTNLRSTGATFEPPNHPKYELGDLLINLEGERKLALSQYLRAEA